jgi:hypothetical protein
MYLILNTAISHRWGMPEPCPIETCSMCWRCYDCTNQGQLLFKSIIIVSFCHTDTNLLFGAIECQCSLPDGMKNCKNLPAEMKIDFIRLYQVRNNTYSIWAHWLTVRLCVYQDEDDASHTLGCSPPNYPTEEFIKAHPGKPWYPSLILNLIWSTDLNDQI